MSKLWLKSWPSCIVPAFLQYNEDSSEYEGGHEDREEEEEEHNDISDEDHIAVAKLCQTCIGTKWISQWWGGRCSWQCSTTYSTNIASSLCCHDGCGLDTVLSNHYCIPRKRKKGMVARLYERVLYSIAPKDGTPNRKAISANVKDE